MVLQLPPLKMMNYTAWAIKAEAILDAHGLWSVVAPAEGKAGDAGKSKTTRAAMLGALPEDLLMQVATKPTAKEVWDSLKVRFVGADRVQVARLAMLHGDFDRLKMADGEDPDGYARRLDASAITMAWYTSLGSTTMRRS